MAWVGKYLTAGPGLAVVGWDMDSTVRLTTHRRWLIPEIRAGRKDWNDYSLLCADDEPNPGAVALMRLLSGIVLNIAVSGASDLAEDLTWEWARRHRVPLDDLVMRPASEAGSSGAPHVFKVNVLRRMQEAGLNVKLFVEDWEQAARSIASQTGIPVLGVNPFDPDSVLVTLAQLTEVLATQGEYVPLGEELAGSVFAALKERTGSQ